MKDRTALVIVACVAILAIVLLAFGTMPSAPTENIAGQAFEVAGQDVECDCDLRGCEITIESECSGAFWWKSCSDERTFDSDNRDQVARLCGEVNALLVE